MKVLIEIDDHKECAWKDDTTAPTVIKADKESATKEHKIPSVEGNTVPFVSIKVGERFKITGKLFERYYIKTNLGRNACGNYFNCINLRSGEFYDCAENDKVTRYDREDKYSYSTGYAEGYQDARDGCGYMPRF